MERAQVRTKQEEHVRGTKKWGKAREGKEARRKKLKKRLRRSAR